MMMMTMTMKSPQLTEQITIRSTASHVSLGFLQPAWKIINIYQSHHSPHFCWKKHQANVLPPPPTFTGTTPNNPTTFLSRKTPPQVLEHRQYLWCHPKAIAPKNFHRLPPPATRASLFHGVFLRHDRSGSPAGFGLAKFVDWRARSLVQIITPQIYEKFW